MKYLNLIIITLTFALLNINVSYIPAQDNGVGKKFEKLFDTKTIETVKGEVTEVTKKYHDKGLGYGLGLKLKTDKETIFIHVGPSWFVEEKDFSFAEGDKIEVTGSRVTFKDNQVIIAAEITKDGKTLILRNADGTPLWIGWGEK